MNLQNHEEVIGLKDILKILVPVLGVVIAGFIATLNLIKKQRIDQDSELKKKVRSIVTTALSLWDNIIYIKFLASSDSQRAKLLFKMPNALVKHCKFDIDKANGLKDEYDASVSQTKEMNVSVFYMLEGGLDNITNNIISGLYPVMKSSGFKKEKQSMVLDIASDIVSELELIIKYSSKVLGRQESRGVLKTMRKNQERFSMEDPRSIPSHLMAIFKPYIKEGKEISPQSIIDFFENETMAWLVTKIPSIGSIVFDNEEVVNSFSKFENIDNVDINNMSEFPSWFPALFSDLAKLHFTEEEINKYVVNNKPFYRLSLTIIDLFGKVTFDVKRKMMELNNGKTDPNSLLQLLQMSIPYQFYVSRIDFDLSDDPDFIQRA